MLNYGCMIDRRFFLSTAFSSSMAYFAAPSLLAAPGSNLPRLRAGIISDTHVRGPGWSLDPLATTLKWFDKKKVDVVAIAGDLTDFGLVEELRFIGKAWDEIFPGNRASDGRVVEKVFVTGNHDNHFYNHARIQKKYPDKNERFNRSIAKDFDAAWRECFHEPFEPFFIKEVKGYCFLGAQYGKKGLAKFVAKAKRRLSDPLKPFFFVQHQHLRNTCHGPNAWGQDNGESTKVLSAFPNAVAFSGHSHYPLTDEKCVWQGDFTSVGTSSLKYVSPTNDVDYENGSKPAQGRARQMPGLSWSRAKHALVMDVFDDRIELSRWAMENDVFESLGENFILPIPFSKPPPYDFKARAEKVKAPEFSPGDKIAFKVAEGETRDKQKAMQLQLSFPDAKEGGRVYDYEVRAVPADSSRETVVRYVLSPNFHLAKKAYANASCVFYVDEIPAECRFQVFPRSSFGKAGKPLCSDLYKRA